jgi:hypothetical protein
MKGQHTQQQRAAHVGTQFILSLEQRCALVSPEFDMFPPKKIHTLSGKSGNQRKRGKTSSFPSTKETH